MGDLIFVCAAPLGRKIITSMRQIVASSNMERETYASAHS